MRMLQHVISNTLKPNLQGEKALEKDYYTILANADKETSAEVLKFKIMELFFPEEAPLLAESERRQLPLKFESSQREGEVESEKPEKGPSFNETTEFRNFSNYTENRTVSIEDLLHTDIPTDHKISPLEALLRNQAHLQMEALKFKQKSDEELEAEKELQSIPAIEQNLALMNEETQMEQEMLSLQETKIPEEILDDF